MIMSNVVSPIRGPLLAVFHPDGDTMINPKWFVIGVALISLSLLFNYDLRFGLAAGALMAFVGAVYLWISIRLAPEHGDPESEREALFRRFSALARNRARARAKELGSKGGPEAG